MSVFFKNRQMLMAPMLRRPHHKSAYQKICFLIFNQDICCGYSKMHIGDVVYKLITSIFPDPFKAIIKRYDIDIMQQSACMA